MTFQKLLEAASAGFFLPFKSPVTRYSAFVILGVASLIWGMELLGFVK